MKNNSDNGVIFKVTPLLSLLTQYIGEKNDDCQLLLKCFGVTVKKNIGEK